MTSDVATTELNGVYREHFASRTSRSTDISVVPWFPGCKADRPFPGCAPWRPLGNYSAPQQPTARAVSSGSRAMRTTMRTNQKTA
jgi:hypothetical protein